MIIDTQHSLTTSDPFVQQISNTMFKYKAQLILSCLVFYTINSVFAVGLFPLPCEQYTRHDDVIKQMTNKTVRFDTTRNYNTRRKIWHERKLDGESLEKAAILSTRNVSVTRKVNGDGMHRTVETCFKVNSELEHLRHKSKCWMMVKEQVPTSLFIDVYQLERSQKQGDSKYFFEEYIDIELPEYESSNHTVLTYSEIDLTQTDCHCKTVVDWHIRYHRPSTDLRVNISLPVPQLFVYCDPMKQDKTNKFSSMNNTCHGNRSGSSFVSPCPGFDGPGQAYLCQWYQMPGVMMMHQITFNWPVGNPSHEFVVTMATMGVTILGAVKILSAVLWAGRTGVRKLHEN